jgi:GntR family transcriptional regulator/MocR family aminotransferase
VTDRAAFPFDAWRRCLLHALRIMARGTSSYRDPAGEEELRLAISRYLAVSRGLACPWQAVMVTQGAQQALDLLARTVVRPGDVVAMEEPGYPPARACFLAAGARVVGVAVDDDGLCVDALPGDARVVYATPAHQFPLGMPMSPARRDALLAWARARDALVIEDDYDGEYRFEGRPLDALKANDGADNIAYVGTFSKTIFPELRIGYVVAPAALQLALRKVRQASDWHGCMLTQLALARFMLDGDFARHQRRMLKLYATRRQALAEAFAGPLAPWFAPIHAVAGIHVTALLRAPLTEAGLLDAARARGLGLTGLAPFHASEPMRPGIVFGYGATSVADIERGVQALQALLRHPDKTPVIPA